MEEFSVDVVIIGSGPAGQKAAIQCSKLGKRVIVIEKRPEPGGNCLYNGTIPSKSLREAIIDLTRFNERSFFGPGFKLGEVTINDLNNRLFRVIDEERSMVHRQFKKNSIKVLQGEASFQDSSTMIIADPRDMQVIYKIQAAHFIIATGSKPRNPQNIPFDNDVILDSTRLLGINENSQAIDCLRRRHHWLRICQLVFCSWH